MSSPMRSETSTGVFPKWVLPAALTFAAIVAGCQTFYPQVKGKPVERTLVVTGYCECGECCNWDRNSLGVPVYSRGLHKGEIKRVGITSSGTRAKVGTAAADPVFFPRGTVFYVEGYGYALAEDTGEDIRGTHIDLFFPSHRQAKKWGKQNLKVKIWAP